WYLCRPDREARAIRTQAKRVEELNAAAAARGQEPMPDGVDLRPKEAGPKECELVGRQVDTVGVRPDVRVVAQARVKDPLPSPGEKAAVVRGAIGAVILHWQLEDRPRSRRVAGVADGDVEVILPAQRSGGADAVERQHDIDEAPDRLIEDARGIGDGRPVAGPILSI